MRPKASRMILGAFFNCSVKITRYDRTMTDAEKVSLFWPVVLSFIFLIAWLVRLEATVKQTKKDVEKNEVKTEQTFNLYGVLAKDFSNGMNNLQVSLARIEGALHIKKE